MGLRDTILGGNKSIYSEKKPKPVVELPESDEEAGSDYEDDQIKAWVAKQNQAKETAKTGKKPPLKAEKLPADYVEDEIDEETAPEETTESFWQHNDEIKGYVTAKNLAQAKAFMESGVKQGATVLLLIQKLENV